jgi:lipid II:glycine glycyltransferase (peptidoglycan interpeptide bridge formation enzyme)
MNFNVKISSNISESEWNDNLSKNTASTIYQTYNWQELYHEAFGSKPVFITITNQDGTVVGQLACLIHEKMLWEDVNPLSKKIGNILKLGTSLWWYHGPIIHDHVNYNEILSIILSSVDKIAKENKVVNIRGISPPLADQFPSKTFQKFGYDSEPRLTFIIDLNQNIDDLYNSLKKDPRYYIRKSEKAGFEFEIAKDMEGLEKFQDLKIEAKKREGKKPFRNPKFYEKHWKIMQNNGYEEWLLVKDHGKIEGTILTLFFNGNVIQHALANSPKKELVGTFLTWNTIKWAQKMKYHTFDFAGVDPSPKTEKEKGIYFYAAKFGGKKIDFFSYTKIIDRKKYYLSSTLKNPRKIVSKIHSYKLKKLEKRMINK